ncbi:inactive peptidyl-prolyl cis-trans isomerase FKBP6 [Ahaetulla prasina]|uniref:inactive peptidyl-prolyl cis-trans isomerase FKBP6 n=1 Tax=Ahaetulla prasina TaxID=499056 RepID=UPI002647AAC7|nr:inactive peptidyl-prolyl cis-trans isomerase FKBP6 [Ahaetulla prasina]
MNAPCILSLAGGSHSCSLLLGPLLRPQISSLLPAPYHLSAERRTGNSRRSGRHWPLPRLSYQWLSHRMQNITGDRGVLKEIIRDGSGETVPPDSSILVKFSGYLEHTDRPFDTNWFKKNPKLMKLGEDITLRGLEVGLLTMRKGELARFLFKPNYAFGTLGCPPLIPPNSTVLFEVELLDFLDSAESDRFFDLPPEQQDRFPLEKIIKVAETEREFGNYLFRQTRFMDAKERYKRASSVLNRICAKEIEKDKVDAARLLVFLNLSLVCLKLERPGRALAYGEKALELDKKNAKALFRCGQLLEMVNSQPLIHRVSKVDLLRASKGKADSNRPFGKMLQTLR